MIVLHDKQYLLRVLMHRVSSGKQNVSFETSILQNPTIYWMSALYIVLGLGAEVHSWARQVRPAEFPI